MGECAPEPGTRLILGLGNPGERYRETRHNCGFLVVEELVRRWRAPAFREECGARCWRVGRRALAMPQTFMNRSGLAARCLLELDGLQPEEILVVYDDVHLELGRLRLRPQGGAGGHRGMESVLEQVRSDHVPRLRLGVRQVEAEIDGEELVDFVLAPFAAQERPRVEAMIGRAADACEVWIEEGVEAAMGRFNAAPRQSDE